MAQRFDVYDSTGKAILTNVASPITIPDLTPNTTYKGYQVAPTGTTEMHPVDDIVTDDEPANAPTLAITSSNGQVSYTITPGDNAGSAVTSYRIYYASATDTDMIAVELGDQLTGTVTGLANGVGYTFEAVSINNAGESDRSNDVTVTPVDPNAPATVTDDSE